MQNISSNLSSESVSLRDVEVLLATYNGEEYLESFLESLCNQVGVKIHLRVSDDGSKDKTLQILESYSCRFDTYSLVEGPGNGPNANFMSLIENSNHMYVALADQDDIWLPNHLIESLNRLSRPCVIGSPALSICRVREFQETGLGEKEWPRLNYDLDVPHLFYENFGRGCTMVLNRELVKVIVEYKSNCSIMHDWWITLLARTFGFVQTTNEIEVQYRLHSNNVIGHPKLTIRNLVIHAFNSRFGKPRHRQIDCLAAVLSKKSQRNQTQNEVENWVRLIHAPIRKRVAIFKPVFILRDDRLQNLLTKLSILFFPCNSPHEC